MARKGSKNSDEGSSGGPGLWIVTFSDCMTLLLCFFVMLVSFSSFDEGAMSRFAGAFETPGFDSVSDTHQSVKDSVVPPRDRAVDHTQAGSNMPTDTPPENTPNPRASEAPLGADAYRDKQVLHVASPRLFWGNGASLTQPGRELLQMVASFMRLIPCDAVIGEIPGPADGRAHPQDVLQRGLDRSLSAVQYLTAREGLPARRFHVSALHGVAPGRFAGKPVLVITLLSGRAYR